MKVSRRNLLKHIGVGLATIPMATPSIARSGIQMLNSVAGTPKNALLIGHDFSARRFIQAAPVFSDTYRISAVIGDIPAQEHIARFEHWEEAMAQRHLFNHVIIADRSSEVVDICEKAMRAGFDVWTDRPIVHDQQIIKSLNNLANLYNVRLRICHLGHGEMFIQKFEIKEI
jgi:predicted dehydrogenase